MNYPIARRSFLRGLGTAGAASGLGWWLHRAESHAGGAGPPKRIIVMQRPNGTVASQWLPNGAGAGATLGPILEPFAALQDQMVVLGGLRIVTSNGGDASHEGGLVTLMTGEPIGETRPPSGDDWKNTAPSIDQILAEQSPDLTGTPFPSLQIAAHNRQDGPPEVANRALSYEGADLPMYPEVKPSLTFDRLFGDIDPTDVDALARARAKNASILDFVDGDLARLRAIAPASERDKLDAHADAIRQLEQSLDGLTGCTPGDAPIDPADSDYFADVAQGGAAQLAILRAALQCDLSRVVTFMWTPGASSIQFEGLYEGMSLFQHHSLSHENLDDATVEQNMAAIDRWYSERTAEFLQSLSDTPDFDGSGSVLDNSIVLYLSEVSVGWTHSFDQMPMLLFGGRNLGLEGGRILDFGGRSTNDLWLSIAPVFGVDLGQLGGEGQSTGPLPGLFT